MARSVHVGALDDERDPHVGPVLVEVVAADAGRDDVDRADVPQRALRRLQRLRRGVVGRRLRAADELDDLHYGHVLLLVLGTTGAAVLSAIAPEGKREGSSELLDVATAGRGSPTTRGDPASRDRSEEHTSE